jgi:hypothetical protein
VTGVFDKGYLGVLGHRDDGGLLKMSSYYRLGQGEVENASENNRQLVSTYSD